MRKIIIILSIIPLLITGCSFNKSENISKNEAKKIADSLNKGFSTEVNIKNKNLEVVADINRSETKSTTIKIKNPKSLSGLTFLFNGSDVEVTFLGFSLSLNNDSVLNQAVAKTIISALNKASTPYGVSFSKEKNAIVAKGETESGDFLLKLNRDDYSLLSLSIDSLDLECKFNNT